jgi:hypothetical protein
MEPKIIKGYVDSDFLTNWQRYNSVKIFSKGMEGADPPALLLVSQDGEEPRVWTEEQVKAMMDDVKSIAAENAMKCYTNRIEAMTPPAPVAFHIDNYLWKKHGITL